MPAAASSTWRRGSFEGLFPEEPLCNAHGTADLRGRLHLCPEAQVTTLLDLYLWWYCTKVYCSVVHVFVFEVCLTQVPKRPYKLVYSLPYLLHDQAKTAHLVGDHYSEDCMLTEQHVMVGCCCKCHRYVAEKSGPDTASMRCSAVTCTSSTASWHLLGV